MNPYELTKSIDAGWRSLYRSKRKPRDPGQEVWKPPYVYASQVKDCAREMALDLMHPEDREDFDDDTLGRFQLGEDMEQDVRALMIAVGKRSDPPFRVVEAQHKFIVHDRAGAREIARGRMDGRVEFQGARGGGNGFLRPIFEVKFGQSYLHIDRVEDLLRKKWHRHSLYQLLMYLLADNNPWGFFVLPRFGFPKLLPVVLDDHLDVAEAALQRVEAAVEARHGVGPLPDFTTDLSLCRMCDHHGKSCNPPLDFGEGVRVFSDEELVEAARTVFENAEAARQHDRAKKLLRDRLRGVDRAILGDFQAEGRFSKLTRFDIPADVKEPYKVVDPEGRFSLKIEKIA